VRARYKFWRERSWGGVYAPCSELQSASRAHEQPGGDGLREGEEVLVVVVVVVVVVMVMVMLMVMVMVMVTTTPNSAAKKRRHRRVSELKHTSIQMLQSFTCGGPP